MAFQHSGKNWHKISVALALCVSIVGCTDPVRDAKNFGDYLNLRNSLLDPSQVGRFDKENPWGTSKPVTWPILEDLDVVEVPNNHWTLATDPVPSDLVVEQKEYVVGEGDILDVSVFELVTPGLEYERRSEVNELGNITLQNLNQVHVAGLTPTQIEDKIGQLAVEKGFLLPKGNGSPGPQVSAQLLQSRARIFSALGSVGAAGEYNIIGTDFRILDALALAHDIPGGAQPGMDYLYVIRPPEKAGVVPAAPVSESPTGGGSSGGSANPLDALDKINSPATAPTTAPAPAPGGAMGPAKDGPQFVRAFAKPIALLSDNPTVLAQADLDAAIGARPGTPSAPATEPAATAPSAVAATTVPETAPAPATSSAEALMNQVNGNGSKPGMIFVDGKWVEVNPANKSNMSQAEAIAAATGISVPRVIRIPINRLKEGDPRYNIVIRPGDVINVPNIEPGEFYLLGHVGRPGVYSITGRKVTLKQAVAASGGLDGVAVPRRCDLIRRVGNTEVTVEVDLQRIFDGEQPDIYLKPNDLVNVGTDAIAPFLAVMRNAYRFTYGFGFTYDRNFYNQPVITQSTGTAK